MRKRSVSINTHGLRAHEFSTEKPDGITRILLLGDSVVFGWGVEQEKTSGYLLNQSLKDLLQPIEVIPAGVCSWNTRTEYEYLVSEGSKISPNIVVLVVVTNDIVPKKGGRKEVEMNRGVY